MGEAKRRKQLGLMPTVLPFEAQLHTDGTVSFVRGPDDARQRRLIEDALTLTQAFGAGWEGEYRGVQVLSGGYRGNRLVTAEDVQAIPVPPLRRVTGELVLGKNAADVDGVALEVEGGAVRLRDQRHSLDGERWEAFPTLRDPQRIMRLLEDHPAFKLQGELIGQFTAEGWAQGRIDITPDPPEDLLEALEDVTRLWHGATPEQWADIHRETLDDPQAEVPQARRTTFELRRAAPLQSPLSEVFAIRRDAEFFPTEHQTYTLDGETWHAYDNPGAVAEEGNLMPELAEFFDMNMVPVTVYADGRVEWQEDDIPAEHAERIREDLRESTGAGNAEAWAEWTTRMFTETFAEELDVPEGTKLPAPVAVRLDLPADALTDDSPLAQTFIESEVTFDGQQWRDLYDEEVPEELSAFAAGQQEN